MTRYGTFALALLVAFPVYADSNKEYARQVEVRLKTVLVPGTPLTQVRALLDKERLAFAYASQDRCISELRTQEQFTGSHRVKCPGGGYLHVRVPVKKVLNPIESGVHVTFLFNADDKLTGHEIRVAHTAP